MDKLKCLDCLKYAARENFISLKTMNLNYNNIEDAVTIADGEALCIDHLVARQPKSKQSC